MKSQPRISVLWIILIALITTAMTSRITVATELTKLSVSPIKVTGVLIGNTFTINVTVADVTALFGYQFLLRYDTTILTATEYKNLAYLTYAPFKEPAPSAINDAEGWVSVAYNCPMGEKVGLTTTEPKPLAEITFRVDDYGTSPLDIAEDFHYTQLADVYGHSITYPYNLIISDGVFSNVEEIILHDIAVTDVTVNATTVKPGEVIAIDITVINNGDFTETFTVTAKYSKTAINFIDIGTKTVTDLEIDASTTVSFTWDTAGIDAGKYIVRAVATLDIDDNPADNTRDSDIITVESHDIAVTFVQAYPLQVIQGQYVGIDVQVANEGTESETFDVTVYYDTTLVNKITVESLFPADYRWLWFEWNTTSVPEGVYTISAVADVVPDETDTTDNTYIDGRVTISIPKLSISPDSGPVGTKVTVKGYGFPARIGGYLTFDDQLIGLIYVDNYGNFTASFNVPSSEAGPHTVKMPIYYYLYPITIEAPFTVTDVTPIDVNLDVGDIFFKGETAEFYAQTASKGKPIDVTSLKATLYMPDGTNKTLTYQRIAIGLYKIRYIISDKGAMTGTYTLMVEANYITDTVNAYGTSIRTFIVKPTWEREAPKIAAFSMASIGLVSVMFLLWRREKKKFL